MSNIIQVNYLAVLLAAVASMVIGFVWYSPVVLGKPWMKLKGYTADSLKKAQKEMGPLYAVSFVAALVTAFVLSHVITMSLAYFHYTLLQTGFTTAIWMWLGFVLPVQVADQIFGEKKWSLLAINTGFQLVSLIAMAIVIAYMM